MRLIALWLFGFASASVWRASSVWRTASEQPDLALERVALYIAAACALWAVFFAVLGTRWVLLDARRRPDLRNFGLVATVLPKTPARVTIILMMLYQAQQWLDVAWLGRSNAARATLGFRALLACVTLALTIVLVWRAVRSSPRKQS